MDEEVLVFHGVITSTYFNGPGGMQSATSSSSTIADYQAPPVRVPEPDTRRLANQPEATYRSNQQNAGEGAEPLGPSEQSTSSNPPRPPVIPPPLQTPAATNNPPLPSQQLSTSQSTPSVRISVLPPSPPLPPLPPPPPLTPSPPAPQRPIPNDPDVRHNIQIVPIQYQALLVKYPTHSLHKI